MKHTTRGEDAFDAAARECQLLVDSINDGIKMLDEVTIIPTSEPDMSNEEAVINSLLDMTNGLAREIEDSLAAVQNINLGFVRRKYTCYDVNAAIINSVDNDGRVFRFCQQTTCFASG